MDIRKQFVKSPLFFVIWASTASFLLYSTMYAYRKPLTAATFDGLFLAGIQYKVILVITQVLGYLTAKFIGIKFIAELDKKRRFTLLIGLIVCSEIALILFALTPHPYGFIWIFFNGLPLGLVWGVVFSYLEGRRFTDILATFLSISFIISSGIMKTIGLIFMKVTGVSEFWMPAAVGFMFLPLLWISAKMLEILPEPDEPDKALRVERLPMNNEEKIYLLRNYSVGLIAVIIVNFLLTVGRDVKDNFLVEIWNTLAPGFSPIVFTQVETIVSFVVLILLALMFLIKNNRVAFNVLHANVLVGFFVIVFTTYLFNNHFITAFWWMTFHGIGVYISYITVQGLFFERFIATFRVKGNIGFLIYISDFVGYLGSCGLLIIREFYGHSISWSSFYLKLINGIGILGFISIACSFVFFNIKYNNLKKTGGIKSL